MKAHSRADRLKEGPCITKTPCCPVRLGDTWLPVADLTSSEALFFTSPAFNILEKAALCVLPAVSSH